MTSHSLRPKQWKSFLACYDSLVPTTDGHLLWPVTDHYGYGRFRAHETYSRRPRDYKAHRLAFMLHGQTEANGFLRKHFGVFLPDGLHVEHMPDCPRNCVNPDHLRLRGSLIREKIAADAR